MSVKPVAFVGYGELGQQVHLLAAPSLSGREIRYFDDNRNREGHPNSFPFGDFKNQEHSDCEFFVCIGYKHLAKKRELVAGLLQDGRVVASVVHPSAHVAPQAKLGCGVFVYPLCNIDKGVVIGSGTLINNSVVVSHDSRIGDGSYLAPGVVVSGNVTIGEECFIGAGAVIANGVTIGDYAIVGIGSVITKSVLAGSSVIGNPARVLGTALKIT
jgi:sugar O-acyltransferase (sialic acid O-acetyltransferase NeuD family)